MNEEMFRELLQSVREAGAIRRGEMAHSRVFVVERPDVKGIRAKFGISQSEFASMLGISVRTLENWEQNRRAPKGPARVLLQISESHPEVVWDVVKKNREGRPCQRDAV